MKYVARVPHPPLDQLVDDLYYLEGAPPYPRLKLPPIPSAVLILNLGDRFVIGAPGTRPAAFADGCLLTAGTRFREFAYPAFTRSVGVHFKPWGKAPFVGIPGSDRGAGVGTVRRRGILRPAALRRGVPGVHRCTPTAYLELRRRFLVDHPGHVLDVGPPPAAESALHDHEEMP